MRSEARLRVPLTEADHWLGPRAASVVLLEYGDYQCPHCGAAYPIVKRLVRSMHDNLGFVFRNFPLNRAHPLARSAAMAAESAALQNRFWEMHDLLFENQAGLEEDTLFAFAEELGLDLDRFARDMRGPKVERRVDADFEGGVRSGVNGTPTFFINGLRYDGDWSHPSLLRALRDVAAPTAA